jgi:hypothetical protein
MKSKKVFYLKRDFYSIPQVIIITAESREKAEETLAKKLAKEHYSIADYEKLTELDISKNRLIILEPPGDRHFDR